MMIELQEIIGRLRANADAIRAMVATISDEQAQWKPDAETWSMREVMEHVYNEERIDFRQHLKEMLADPPQGWGALDEGGYLPMAACGEALELFLKEREASIAWLQGLKSPDWDFKLEATFGPQSQPEVVTLSAGEVLYSWVAHDFLHLRQMNELLYAWNEKQAAPYAVRYAGGW